MMTKCNFKTQGNSHRRQWGVNETLTAYFIYFITLNFKSQEVVPD